MVKRVDSCPPCKELLDVKVAKGLSIRSPEAHIAPVQSKKVFKGCGHIAKSSGAAKR